VALLSAFRLWRIGRYEERRDRLTALSGAAIDRTVRVQRLNWYSRLGSIVAASAIVGTAEQQRLLGALAASGVKGHGNLATFVASKVCGAFVAAALVWLFLEWQQLFADLMIIRVAVLFGALLLGWR